MCEVLWILLPYLCCDLKLWCNRNDEKKQKTRILHALKARLACIFYDNYGNIAFYFLCIYVLIRYKGTKGLRFSMETGLFMSTHYLIFSTIGNFVFRELGTKHNQSIREILTNHTFFMKLHYFWNFSAFLPWNCDHNTVFTVHPLMICNLDNIPQILDAL